jgi:hypothetical protein
MYIRQVKTKNKKTNTVYTKLVLVESYRTEKGPRQRTIISHSAEERVKAVKTHQVKI